MLTIAILDEEEQQQELQEEQQEVLEDPHEIAVEVEVEDSLMV